MHLAVPSRTALRVALRRAAHQRVDPKPLVFPDPFAIAILGPHAAELGRTPRRPSSVALRAWLVVRSRFAEDALAASIARAGVTQYLVLGAGLDTFALRNPYGHLQVFEVDHPATQQWKRDLLAAASLPVQATMVPVDFEQQSLAAELLRSGFDPARPTQVSCLGVVPYLSHQAFRKLVQFVTTLPFGSGLVLDYGLPRHLLPVHEQLEHDSLAARVSRAGEPFRLVVSPDQMRAELHAFSHLEDLGRDELNAHYLSHPPESSAAGLRLRSTAARLVSAVR